MKKILIIISILLMTISTSYASANYALKHANPMPNLVRYALGNAELLQLSPKQVTEIKAWATENKPKMKKMVQHVMHQEMMLLEEALTTDKDVLKNADAMLETRRDIIKMKTLCRAHLKNVLSEKQYSQVVGIYRSTLPKKHKK